MNRSDLVVFVQMTFDPSYHLFDIQQYVVICKSHHFNVKFFKSFRSHPIVKFCLRGVVNRPVELNHKPMGMTIKIHDIVVDRMLPPEFDAKLIGT